MNQMSKWILRCIADFVKRDDGPTAVEYAVMLMLIVIVCIASITTLGSNTNAAFSFVGSSIQAAQ
jgi:pilus assembly protein Flp/PilA